MIVLSGRASEADRVRGLAAGADDYMVKPFHYPELAARVAAVLRRGKAGARGRSGSASWSSTRPQALRVGEREVKLANKEFALLRALASEPRRVFTKDELLRDVWGFRSRGAPAPSTRTRAACVASWTPRGAVRIQLLGRRLPADRRVGR